MSGSYADLSLSELSLNDKPIAGPSKQPFSLLARPSVSPPVNSDESPQEPQSILQELDGQDNVDQGDQEVVEEGEENVLAAEEEEDGDARQAESKRSVAFDRDERLRRDLFVLRKLNAAFSLYNDALGDVQSGTERVSEQLTQTNALLDKYVGLLVRSEKAAKLIFDERWWGAEEDEQTLADENRRAEEQARKEAEEHARAEQAERERLAKEEAERSAREEQERVEAARREKLAARAGYGGVRGVRGTRATAMRARGASTVSRTSPGASGLPRGTTASSVARGARPGPSASGRSSVPNRPR